MPPSPLAAEVEPVPPVEVAPPASRPPRMPSLDDEQRDLRRATTELEAVKRRVERDALRARDDSRGELVRELIPVLDNLDRTLGVGSTDVALLSGVELVRAQLERVLGSYGLERIDAVGTRFNPAEHEAVATAPVDDPARNGVVVDAFSRGYRLGGRVLVPARVRVGKLARPA